VLNDALMRAKRAQRLARRAPRRRRSRGHPLALRRARRAAAVAATNRRRRAGSLRRSSPPPPCASPGSTTDQRNQLPTRVKIGNGSFTETNSFNANTVTAVVAVSLPRPLLVPRPGAQQLGPVGLFERRRRDHSSAIPAAPAKLVATALSASQIKLTWQDKSNNETGFGVEVTSPTSTGFLRSARWSRRTDHLHRQRPRRRNAVHLPHPRASHRRQLGLRAGSERHDQRRGRSLRRRDRCALPRGGRFRVNGAMEKAERRARRRHGVPTSTADQDRALLVLRRGQHRTAGEGARRHHDQPALLGVLRRALRRSATGSPSRTPSSATRRRTTIRRAASAARPTPRRSPKPRRRSVTCSSSIRRRSATSSSRAKVQTPALACVPTPRASACSADHFRVDVRSPRTARAATAKRCPCRATPAACFWFFDNLQWSSWP
jgi:hypothetical protein